MKVIILQGPPAAGKTTWSHNYIDNLSEEERNRTTLICYDELKNKNIWGTRRETTKHVEHKLIEEALEKGNDVIIDAVNLYQRNLDELIDIANKHNAEYEIVKLYVPYKEAVERDSHRSRPLGPRVIKHFYEKYFSEKYKEENNN